MKCMKHVCDCMHVCICMWMYVNALETPGFVFFDCRLDFVRVAAFVRMSSPHPTPSTYHPKVGLMDMIGLAPWVSRGVEKSCVEPPTEGYIGSRAHGHSGTRER